MNAPLFNLKCHVCGQIQQSMTILLPEHSGFTALPLCNGSNTLAKHFVDPCPVCEVHGRSKSCPCCKGTNEVYTPIRFTIQEGNKEHGEWVFRDVENIDHARNILKSFFNNPDDVISAMYAGELVKDVWHRWRIKPGTNQTRPDDEPSLNEYAANMLDEIAYNISTASFPDTMKAARVSLSRGESVEAIEKTIMQLAGSKTDRVDILMAGIRYMATKMKKG